MLFVYSMLILWFESFISTTILSFIVYVWGQSLIKTTLPQLGDARMYCTQVNFTECQQNTNYSLLSCIKQIEHF